MAWFEVVETLCESQLSVISICVLSPLVSNSRTSEEAVALDAPFAICIPVQSEIPLHVR